MVVPAFAEEMNKTRKMLTETGKALNKSGIALINPDLFGTGDSEGRFEETDWATWVQDLRTVRGWCQAQGWDVRAVLAVRSGALLAADFARQSVDMRLAATVFWQPVRTGAAVIKQMLRMRTVSSAVSRGVRETVEQLMAKIRGGETVFAAGYGLAARLVEPLLPLRLEDCVPQNLGTLSSMEAVRSADLAAESVDVWGDQRVHVWSYAGEPYWSSTEVVCDMQLVTRTADSLIDAIRTDD
jgi:exosortase A-associated hydrolase 2